MAQTKFTPPSTHISVEWLRVKVETGDNRVLRGGSWINNGRNCRSAYRNFNDPANRNDNCGFRLARAQYAVGMSVHDQTLILFCRHEPMDKKKRSPDVLVMRLDDRMNALRPTAFILIIRLMSGICQVTPACM